jgi:hypothetical protein
MLLRESETAKCRTVASTKECVVESATLRSIATVAIFVDLLRTLVTTAAVQGVGDQRQIISRSGTEFVVGVPDCVK